MVSEELFGSIPPGWEYKTLAVACAEGGGDIQTGPFGSQLHAADYVPVGIPSIMPQNIGDNRLHEEGIARITSEDAQRLSRYLVRTGDIVYSRRGDVERRALVRAHEDGWLCGTGCLRVRLGEKGADPKFVSHYLGHPSVREWIVRHAHGATMPNLNTSILGACPFLEPPIEEQRAIAHILGTLDDKIELNRKQNETLEAMARALFKAWFVDFEPVRAKIDGRWQRGQSLPGMPAHLYDLFPDRLVESELGEIPDGWRSGTVGDSFALTMGQSPPGDTYNGVGDGLPFFQGRTDFGFRYPENRKYCSSPNRVAKAEDTLVSVRAPVGDINLAWEECCIGRGVAAVRHISDARSFTYHALWSLQNQLKQFEHSGTVFGAINKKQFEALAFIEPSRDLVESFERSVGPFDDQIRSNLDDSRTLAQLRDTLLPKLISGELRIRDAEAFLKERGL